MSLLDPIAVCDAVLQTVMQQDIYLAVRTDAPLGGGAGTWDDPFYAAQPNPGNSPAIDTSNAALFDAIMNDPGKVPAGSTVHLGPGTFCTKGNQKTGGGAWQPRVGCRLLGSGIGVTTLKLVNVPVNEVRYAIGMSLSSGALQGFEASDFTIIANLSGNTASGSGSSGIAVHGKDVYLQRITVTDFGVRNGAALSDGHGAIIAASDGSQNCIISECVAQSPGAANNGQIAFFLFGGTLASPHYFCAIRRCSGRGVDAFYPIPAISSYFAGIAPGVGVGTIVEGNQLANCHAGVRSASAAKDLVIWNNYFRNVSQGVELILLNPDLLGRVIIEDNIIELTPQAGVHNGVVCGGQVGLDHYTQIVVRRNLIQDASQPVGVNQNLIGIQVTNFVNAVVENNILNNISSAKAVYYAAGKNFQSFNNQDSGGTLFRPLNTQTGSAYNQELADLVRLIPITIRPGAPPLS
jgi:hypothetical protein